VLKVLESQCVQRCQVRMRDGVQSDCLRLAAYNAGVRPDGPYMLDSGVDDGPDLLSAIKDSCRREQRLGQAAYHGTAVDRHTAEVSASEGRRGLFIAVALGTTVWARPIGRVSS
jgi:hypothetical protein